MNDARKPWFRAQLTSGNPWVASSIGLILVTLLVPLLTFGGVHGNLHASVPLLFIIPVLVASFMGGGGAGVVVSVAAVLAWDWFFIQPLHQIRVSEPADAVALSVFLCIALFTGQLSTLVRRRGIEAIQRAGTTEALYDVSTALIGSHDLNAVLPVLAQRLQDSFDLQCCVILLKATTGDWRTVAVAGEIPTDLDLTQSRSVAGVLAWVDRTGQMSGLGDTLATTPSALQQSGSFRRAQFWPLTTGTKTVGVLELVFRSGVHDDRERDRLLATLVNAAALSVEHNRLFQDEQSAAIARESDRLKSALLSSVSHDLRTPLASIKAAATSLLQDDVEWSDADRIEFLTDINVESDRLARFVSNLLDLSRIEAGALKPVGETEDVIDLVARVVRRFTDHRDSHRILFQEPKQDLECYADPVHVEQILTNLIENAIKYSPASCLITVSAGTGDVIPDTVLIAVHDEGPGIPREEQSRIFDTFYRGSDPDKVTSGTGMGLAIVKGLVEANRGLISVESSADSGTTFTITLPATADDNFGLGED